MALPRFFKLKTPNRFNYTPLYWDPEKGAREERVRRIKAELGHEVEFTNKSSTITRGAFRQYSSTKTRLRGRESTIRLLVIAAVLMLLAYILFYR